MKIALISDIHGNLPALQACLKLIDASAPDLILCMGDLVGYGPQPNEVIDIIRARNIPCVEGNHDAAITGRMPMEFFREPNQSLLKWTRKNITRENLDYLKSLPLRLSSAELSGMAKTGMPENSAESGSATEPDKTSDGKSGEISAGGNPYSSPGAGTDSPPPEKPDLPDDLFLMAHANPDRPERWEYLNSAVACRQALKNHPFTFILVGHTHIPAVIASELGVFGMEPGFRYVINPGAVGQNRDGDQRASYMMLDTEAWTCELKRVSYPIQHTIAAYDAIGIGSATARRLLHV